MLVGEHFEPKMRGLSRADRFAKFVEIDEQSGCWLWTGWKNAQGYGKFSMGKKAEQGMAAHRASMLIFGADPRGQFVLHRCDVPACVNPNHLFLGTQADNRLDCKAKGRTARGDRSGTVKLPDSRLPEVFALRSEGKTYKQIGMLVGLGKLQVRNILLGLQRTCS